MAGMASRTTFGRLLVVTVASLLLVLVAGVERVDSMTNDVHDDGWLAFKERYGKNYTNETEDHARFVNFTSVEHFTCHPIALVAVKIKWPMTF